MKQISIKLYTYHVNLSIPLYLEHYGRSTPLIVKFNF